MKLYYELKIDSQTGVENYAIKNNPQDYDTIAFISKSLIDKFYDGDIKRCIKDNYDVEYKDIIEI
jgi:hypothetical protein